MKNPMTLTIILSLVAIGLLAGLLSGTVGVGGGIIMVPLMVYLLAFDQHTAQGMSLAVLAVPVTFIAAYNYHTTISPLDWRYALIIAVCFVVGGYFGSKIAVNLNQQMLKKVFGIIMLIAAIKMIFFSGGK